jgi:hypothetical protein
MYIGPKSGDLVIFDKEPVATVFDTTMTPLMEVVSLTRGGQHFDVPLAMLTPHGTQLECDVFRSWELALPLHHAAIDDHRTSEVRHDAGV